MIDNFEEYKMNIFLKSIFLTSFRKGKTYIRVHDYEFVCVNDDSRIHLTPVIEEEKEVFYIDGKRLINFYESSKT